MIYREAWNIVSSYVVERKWSAQCAANLHKLAVEQLDTSFRYAWQDLYSEGV